MRILYRQLGLVSFAPLKSAFVEIYSTNAAFSPGIAGTDASAGYLEREHDSEAPKGGVTAPKVPATYTLAGLEGKLARGYKLVTEGKFSGALEVCMGGGLMLLL